MTPDPVTARRFQLNVGIFWEIRINFNLVIVLTFTHSFTRFIDKVLFVYILYLNLTSETHLSFNLIFRLEKVPRRDVFPE